MRKRLKLSSMGVLIEPRERAVASVRAAFQLRRDQPKDDHAVEGTAWEERRKQIPFDARIGLLAGAQALYGASVLLLDVVEGALQQDQVGE